MKLNLPEPKAPAAPELPVWVEAVASPSFPELDVALRSGQHVVREHVALYTFLSQYLESLQVFYARFGLELLQAKEGFFYLRAQPEALVPRSLLSPFEVLVGKVLCLLYFSPDQLKGEGLYPFESVMATLTELVGLPHLFQLQRARATGTQLDLEKLRERVRTALNRLKRLGMVSCPSQSRDSEGLGLRFRIHESIFRFAADVRSDLSPLEAQKRLIMEGELVGSPTSEAGGGAEEGKDASETTEWEEP